MKFLIGVIFLLLCNIAYSTVIRGPDGRWYGNICVTQIGWEMINWQPLGSICYSPKFRQYGFIVNA